MPLVPNTRLGPYELLSPIGAGGMGEVWKARDTRLGRIVAIKVSHEQFSERFEREARAVAALNHPNICQLYDVGPDYIVLEYVEGSPVAPTDNFRKLLDLAVQIAEGMAAAHLAGVVHRDLKPANVLVTPEGRIKILDFGLAKIVTKPDQSDATQALTLTTPGAVAGTPAYMSPEQAAGSSNIDARSDQFSLGLMLYEMASGNQAFKRPTAVETLAAIVREDPEPLPATVPPPLRWIIQRCLAKDPRDRYESSRDLYLDLRSLREHLSDASTTTALAAVGIPAAEPAPTRSRPLRIAMASLAAGVILTAATAFLLRPAPQHPAALRYTPFSFEQGGQDDPVWSPDGKAVAFDASEKNTDPAQIYVRYLDSSAATQLTHLPESTVAVAWTSAGRIIFARFTQPAGLWSVSPVGGEPEQLRAFVDGDLSTSISRDGSALALWHTGDDGVSSLWIASPPTAPLKKYDPAPFATRSRINVPQIGFSPDGKQILLFRNASAGEEAWLMPYPANPSKPPHRILANLPAFGGTPPFSWLPDNRRVVLSTTSAPSASPQLYIADTVSGDFSTLSGGTIAQTEPAVSPDGNHLVYVEGSSNFDIVNVDLATLAVTPLIATQRAELMPSWNPGGSALVYVTNRNGPLEIWLHKPGQTDRPIVTARDFPPDTTQWFMSPVPSPDAGRVIYSRIERGGRQQLWMSAVAGGSPVPLVRADQNFGFGGSWSPDGNWFAYLDYREGKFALDKVKTTGQAEPEILKPNRKLVGNWLPAWSPKGDWIMFPEGGATLISPDGKTIRVLDSLKDSICTFSHDESLLYCLHQSPSGGPLQLFTANLDGKTQRMIGTLAPEYAPSSFLSPALGFTLTADGKSLTYATVKSSYNLWLMDGLNQK